MQVPADAGLVQSIAANEVTMFFNDDNRHHTTAIVVHMILMLTYAIFQLVFWSALAGCDGCESEFWTDVSAICDGEEYVHADVELDCSGLWHVDALDHEGVSMVFEDCSIVEEEQTIDQTPWTQR